MAAVPLRMARPMSLAARGLLSSAVSFSSRRCSCEALWPRRGSLRIRAAACYSTAASSSPSSSPSTSASTSSTPSTANNTIQVDGRDYQTDAWFNAPHNVIAAASRRLHLQKDHPVAITRQIIESRFPAPTYRYHNSLHPVVSTFQNFDSLGFPPDHPGRARSDTYYINKDTLLRTHTSAHELETFRSNASPGFLLSADVYRRDEVDRTHYPVFHQMEGAHVWDRRDVATGDGRGNLTEAIYADLAQLPKHDMVVEDPNPPFHPERNPLQAAAHHAPDEVEALGAHLKRSLELMVVEVFTRAKRAAARAAAAEGREAPPDEPLRVRWVEAYFPFTSPSWELEVYYQGDWLECLGCGISRQEILVDAGVPTQMGWAFGIGLDRIAMLLFQIPDIRLFWSQDERFLSQFAGVSDNLDKMRLFVPFSKHPACYKDVSFWLPTTAPPESSTTASAPGSPATSSTLSTSSQSTPTVHPNDVMEVIRSIAGDTVEDVKLVDEFTHPKTKRQSQCFRINYRSLERTLTNAETNELHDEVTGALVERLGVTIR